jgi:glycosyltransferase involved in cell wall biosynthesis
MKRLGIFVGEHGNWTFFNEIYADLAKRYQTDVFVEKKYNIPLLYGRYNRWSYRNGIKQIVGRNDICFFEWASELLVEATHMPKKCAMVTRLHSYELYAWAPKVNWDHVDRIILVSKAMGEKFCAIYPDHAHKTTVIYNAKPLDLFAPVEKPFTLQLGMLCSLNPRKRVYEIIMMLSELRARGYDAHLHIAGGELHGADFDEYHVALHLLVSKLGLEGKVSFYDHISDTAGWLRNIDIFISNSYWEGHQVALVEAMATACQCYSHFWDGVEEVLPPENIYATENELCAKIIAYSQLSDAERYNLRMKMRAIACEMFDANRQHQEIVQVVEGALAARP